MIYKVDKGKLIENKGDTFYFNAEDQYLCLFNSKEFLAYSETFGINDPILKEVIDGHSFKFESHEKFDFMSLNILKFKEKDEYLDHITIYFRHNLLIFVADHPEELQIVEKVEMDIEEDSGRDNFSLGRILYVFFDELTKYDSLQLEDIEELISDLEEAIMTSKDQNPIRQIVEMRKKLLTYRRYYDRLLSVSESIEENVNGLLTKDEVRYFSILTDRNKRLFEDVRYLQDYLSQIREAYQSQVDINLNSIMKISTVITTIFLPLTLIVGWYGMNFNMPEYQWAYGYPLVIIVSVIISVLIIIYFKKNKWF